MNLTARLLLLSSGVLCLRRRASARHGIYLAAGLTVLAYAGTSAVDLYSLLTAAQRPGSFRLGTFLLFDGVGCIEGLLVPAVLLLAFSQPQTKAMFRAPGAPPAPGERSPASVDHILLALGRCVLGISAAGTALGLAGTVLLLPWAKYIRSQPSLFWFFGATECLLLTWAMAMVCGIACLYRPERGRRALAVWVWCAAAVLAIGWTMSFAGFVQNPTLAQGNLLGLPVRGWGLLHAATACTWNLFGPVLVWILLRSRQARFDVAQI